MPHKQTIITHIDKVDETASMIGAVNTVVNENRFLTGHNTDIRGVIDPLENVLSLKNASVTVLGTGGAARAAIVGLLQASARVTLWGRNPDHVLKLTTEFPGIEIGTSSIEEASASTVLINATSVGMGLSAESVVGEDLLRPDQVVFDMVYRPLVTPLLHFAKQKGCAIINGSEMFLSQAAMQFELFTGVRPPLEEMRKFLMPLLGQ